VIRFPDLRINAALHVFPGRNPVTAVRTEDSNQARGLEKRRSPFTVAGPCGLSTHFAWPPGFHVGLSVQIRSDRIHAQSIAKAPKAAGPVASEVHFCVTLLVLVRLDI
jgi:hypothetical protein